MRVSPSSGPHLSCILLGDRGDGGSTEIHCGNCNGAKCKLERENPGRLHRGEGTQMGHQRRAGVFWVEKTGRNTSAGAPRPLPSGLGNSYKFSTNGERDELCSKREQSNHRWSEPLTPKNHLSPGRMDTYRGDTHRFYVYFEEYTFKHI